MVIVRYNSLSFNLWEKQNCEVFLIDVEKNILLVTIITMNRNILVVTTSVQKLGDATVYRPLTQCIH